MEEENKTRLLSVRETQELLNVSRTFLDRIVRLKSENKLPSYKIGRHRKFRYEDIQWWIEKQRAA